MLIALPVVAVSVLVGVVSGCGDKDGAGDSAAASTTDGGAMDAGSTDGATTDGGASTGPQPAAITSDCEAEDMVDVQFPSQAGAMLRVVMVDGASGGGESVTVRVDEERLTVLFLASRQEIAWNVEEAHAGVVREVHIANDDGTLGVDAPATASVISHFGGSALTGEDYRWTSPDRATLLEWAVEETKLVLASYTACDEPSFITFDEGSEWPDQPELVAYDPYPDCPKEEPRDSIVEADTSVVTGLSACAGVVAESAWCLTQASNGFVAIGMDTGESCEVLDHDGDRYGQSHSHAWTDQRLLYCGIDGIVTELSLDDGAVRWADLWCENSLTWDDQLWLQAESNAVFTRYDAFFDTRCSFWRQNADGVNQNRVGAEGDTLVSADDDDTTVDSYGLSGMDDLGTVALQGFTGNIDGLDLVGDTLFVNDTDGGSIRAYDLSDGTALSSVPGLEEGTTGLSCFAGG